jgi:hypothetical protein
MGRVSPGQGEGIIAGCPAKGWFRKVSGWKGTIHQWGEPRGGECHYSTNVLFCQGGLLTELKFASVITLILNNCFN